MFYRCQRFIYNYTKLTVRNTVDYSGQEKLFGKTGQARTVRALAADRPRHKDDPRTEPMQKSESALWTVRRISADRLNPRSDRPTSGADRPVGKDPKNPKVTGSEEWIIAASRTVRGTRPDRCNTQICKSIRTKIILPICVATTHWYMWITTLKSE
jgi:hypothetical protein